MITMDPRAVRVLSELPMELTHVRDLEEFDGALVSEFRSSTGEPYVYYWCDSDAHVNRWTIIRTLKATLLRYLVGRLSLLDLIQGCPDGYVFLADIDAALSVVKAWLARVEQIPAEYLPSTDSLYTSGAQNEPGFQDAYVGDGWDFDSLRAYERKYLQAYAFQAAFGKHGDPGSIRINYTLNGGWSYHSLFEMIRANAAISGKGARMSEIKAASPGYLRFRVASEHADGLRLAVSRYLESRSSLGPYLRALNRWCNDKEDMTDEQARRMIDIVTTTLGLNGQTLVQHSNQAKAAAKSLNGYVNRLRYLADNDENETFMMVGLEHSKPGG